ncbi:uncharacterized protein SPSK_10602 [Sporothrix schenckii 1099-18]|uniref:Uncharacterized protein n=1 Tax=Sporothrix schenckii 1099-18 TaxID=1397361 RepID=A0A0F2M2Z1_SPOSC|nr:uncharacterized protein SPSK_10602 [Sporothrix schenckii 1099-18]KJR83130.1 hypothetical protein SPSK_10602 [Sporothrix schenckii 1099-18]
MATKGSWQASFTLHATYIGILLLRRATKTSAGCRERTEQARVVSQSSVRSPLPGNAKCLDWLDWDIVPTPGIVREEEEEEEG